MAWGTRIEANPGRARIADTARSKILLRGGSQDRAQALIDETLGALNKAIEASVRGRDATGPISDAIGSAKELQRLLMASSEVAIEEPVAETLARRVGAPIASEDHHYQGLA